MAKTETIRARVEPELKSEAEAILKTLGLSASEAMRLFLFQVIHQRGLPFDVKIPNAKTISAIEELEAGSGIRVSGIEELLDDTN